jgi:hypothetical protein
MILSSETFAGKCLLGFGCAAVRVGPVLLRAFRNCRSRSIC